MMGISRSVPHRASTNPCDLQLFVEVVCSADPAVHQLSPIYAKALFFERIQGGLKNNIIAGN
jgi:hypothetical protein